MTQEQQQQVEVISGYDGWALIRDNVYEELGGKNLSTIDNMQYHTSDDWIMPVARKVFSELDKTIWSIIEMDSNEIYMDAIDHRNIIKSEAMKSTAELCTACYNAIVFLNTLKPVQ